MNSASVASIENNSDNIAPWIQTFINTIEDLQGSEVESGNTSLEALRLPTEILRSAQTPST